MQFTFTYLFTQNRVSPWKHTKQNTQKYKHKWMGEQRTLTEQKWDTKAAASISCLVHQSFDGFLDTKASVSSYKYNVEK